MRNWRNSAFAAAAIAVTLGAVTSLSIAQSTDEGLIQYRKAVMGAQGGHMGAISRIVRGEVEFDGHLAAHAQALNDLANMVPDSFAEPGSGAETRALPLIWEDHDGFLEKAEALQTATLDLVSAAETGDQEAIGAALGPVGASCQGCHETYRSQ
ncbi:MAG: c-type cytochrome [Alphaproteobacteria bacterium]